MFDSLGALDDDPRAGCTDDERAVLAALRSGTLGSEAEVDRLEAHVARRFGRCRVVATSSGSTAIELVLRAAGIGGGDGVAVPALTCRSVADAVRACGARPVFVDVDAERMTIDPAALARAGAVSAVIAVDQYGCEAAIDDVVAVASGALAIHDVAPSLGLATGQPPTGVVRVASLHPSKVLGAGEGGLVLTIDADLADRVRYLRSPGALSVRGVAPPPGMQGVAGFSARMSDLDAALATARLAHLDQLLADRRERAAEYDAVLSAVTADVARRPPSHRHAFAAYPLALADAATAAALVARAARHRLPLGRGYGTLHDRHTVACPVAERAAACTVCLPTGRDAADARSVLALLLSVAR